MQKVNVPWNKFDEMAEAGSPQTEICAVLGLSVDTLERKCKEDKGMSIAAYMQQKKSILKSNLRKNQLMLAQEGNPAMAIWLGKQHLNQSDKPLDSLVETMNVLGLSTEQAIDILIKNQELAQKQNKKSFTEFCVDAGYPAPFAKQLEMVSFFLDANEPSLLLGARKYGKTEYLTILGPAYDVYVNSLSSTNLIITKSKDRNTAIMAEIKNALEKNGVVLEKANSTMLRVKGLRGKDPSVAAITLRAISWRGRHPKRIVMDDPVTEDDTSEAVRKLAEKKYNEAYKLTKNIIIIGQPAHKFDLYSKLRNVIRKMEVPWGSIPELDDDLVAQAAAGVDQKSIEASYHLRILTEGSTPFDNIKYLDTFPAGESSVCFIDPSHKGGDFTAVTIFKQHFDGVAVVGFAWQKAWNHCLDDLAPLLGKYKVARMAIETNGLGTMSVDILNQSFPYVGCVGVNSTDNKHSKIMAAGAYAHMIHLSRESMQVYTDQVVQYEYGSKHDDCPDSLASGLKWVGLIRGK